MNKCIEFKKGSNSIMVVERINVGDGGKEMMGVEVEVEVKGAGSLDRSTLLHLVKEVLGFLLYMHQQIPSVLPSLELEFDTLKLEHEELGIIHQNEAKPAARRQLNVKRRVVKVRLKRLEKLMSDISCLMSAFELLLDQVPSISRIAFVLGGSIMRPLHVYEILFPKKMGFTGTSKECRINNAAEFISRKAIRALLSIGAGSVSYPGPMKLFLLIQVPLDFNVPPHFFPKRDFRLNKKMIPLRLNIKCKDSYSDLEESQDSHEVGDGGSRSGDSFLTNMIWLQCKHAIKGVVMNSSRSQD